MDKPSVIKDIPEGEKNWNRLDNQQKYQTQTQELPLMCLILTMSRFDYLVDYPMYEISLRVLESLLSTQFGRVRHMREKEVPIW